MGQYDFLQQTKGRLIVSCQALEDEPLHSSFIMSRMAKAVTEGGAAAIRANSVADITEIKATVSLPIIGIIKRVYPGSDVYITPARKEVDDLISCGVDVIATDATARTRPDGKSLDAFFEEVRKAYPAQLFMADCSTAQEAQHAEKLGFDIVSTTLCGYTEYTKGQSLPNFDMIREILETVKIPLIVEGGIWDAQTFAKIHATEGVHAVVIGSAITRPLEITRHFLKAIQGGE